MVVTICVAQCFSKHFAFFLYLKWDLQVLLTIPSNFSRAKQERMKVATTFKWAPTNPITCPNFGASGLVQNEYYL